MRKARARPGSRTRNTNRQAATAVNAASVPALAKAAISSSRATPASAATSTAVNSVIATGVPVRALTLDKPRGNKPSRDITKKMRLCPYKNASNTVGNAMIATAPITKAALPWPSSRRISANGSGLLPNTVKLIAPTAASATST